MALASVSQRLQNTLMVFLDSHTESDLPCGFTPRAVVSHIILTNGNVSRRLVQKHRLAQWDKCFSANVA